MYLYTYNFVSSKMINQGLLSDLYHTWETILKIGEFLRRDVNGSPI